ncbi:MAG: nitrite reductase [Thiobacillus sp. 63-78]|uniref:nitrite reductase small subunit NirD n=1 Tax=Thiobacillus sp. 63-78 TaxID=1895859 RepID=UPI00086B797C|nr:nitrite reductase small subunit NirD [Thiobacillus sp. 63-78]ODV11527.1 MAG: nitrite reductase [Thiobacillus sp. SCN 64-317]OJZ15639.1 MAG: nitrite reductase [Thiobacillus sp. 63-78]
MNHWIDILAVADIPRPGARVVRHADIDIAVFRNAEDNIFALEDRCPHKGGPLSQGIVHGKKVTCPLHGWNVELDSGCAAAPDEGCAREFPVRIEDGRVWLDLTAIGRATA